jgi:hypothetical protein
MMKHPRRRTVLSARHRRLSNPANTTAGLRRVANENDPASGSFAFAKPLSKPVCRAAEIDASAPDLHCLFLWAQPSVAPSYASQPRQALRRYFGVNVRTISPQPHAVKTRASCILPCDYLGLLAQSSSVGGAAGTL